jgi:multidrug resistance efflux pump
MEEAAVISGLLEKRAELERSIAELERQIRMRRAEIGQLDSTICMFAPSIIDAKRQATRFKRSAHFLTGELTRQCQDSLREAKGRLITATEIAVTALHQKGLNSGDAELKADFTKRIAWTLNRMLRSGAVVKHGYGMAALWGLPTI